jgi:hypothetical protein
MPPHADTQQKNHGKFLLPARRQTFPKQVYIGEIFSTKSAKNNRRQIDIEGQAEQKKAHPSTASSPAAALAAAAAAAARAASAGAAAGAASGAVAPPRVRATLGVELRVLIAVENCFAFPPEDTPPPGYTSHADQSQAPSAAAGGCSGRMPRPPHAR